MYIHLVDQVTILRLFRSI